MISAASAAVALAQVGFCWNCVHLARQQVDVVLNHVEPALRRRQPCYPVHPTHVAMQRRGKRQGLGEATWSAVLHLCPLARQARAHILRHVDILARPEGQASHQEPVSALPKCPKVSVDLVSSGNREAPARTACSPVGCTACPRRPGPACIAGSIAPLPSARWGPRGVEDGWWTSLPSVTAAARKIGLKKASTASSRTKSGQTLARGSDHQTGPAGVALASYQSLGPTPTQPGPQTY
jgi:hypothetical protein